MIVKIFLTAVFAAACAQEIMDKSDVEILKRLTEEGKRALEVVETNIMNSPKEFDRYIEDRLGSLKWEGISCKTSLNLAVGLAVFEGMKKNKQFSNFQCISKEAKETESKLDAISNQISPNSENIKQRELTGIMRLSLILRVFYAYLDELFQTKSNQLTQAENESTRKKILEEFGKKIKLLNSITEKMNSHVKEGLFTFFEKYVDFAFKTEKTFTETTKNGINAIMRCVF